MAFMVSEESGWHPIRPHACNHNRTCAGGAEGLEIVRGAQQARGDEQVAHEEGLYRWIGWG